MSDDTFEKILDVKAIAGNINIINQLNVFVTIISMLFINIQS